MLTETEEKKILLLTETEEKKILLIKIVIFVFFVHKKYSLVLLLSVQGQKTLGYHQKYLNLCSEDERRSSVLGTT